MRLFNCGYISRAADRHFRGELSIDGVDISPITALYFSDEGKQCLWLRREQALVFDFDTQTYHNKERSPKWECFLVRDKYGVYHGTFVFLRFKYRISGTFENEGEDGERLVLDVERMPKSEQTIINKIKERNKK